MRRLLVALSLVAATLGGCTAQEAKTANDLRLALCDHLGAENAKALADQAKLKGVSPDALLAIWKASCLIRMSAASDSAVGAIGWTTP